MTMSAKFIDYSALAIATILPEPRCGLVEPAVYQILQVVTMLLEDPARFEHQTGARVILHHESTKERKHDKNFISCFRSFVFS
jgi:hypothetical protein